MEVSTAAKELNRQLWKPCFFLLVKKSTTQIYSFRDASYTCNQKLAMWVKMKLHGISSLV